MAGLDPAIHPYTDQQMSGFAYILANRKRGALYIGVTSNLIARIHKHRTDPKGFVRRYSANQLVWYEEHERIEGAIQREKNLKRWERAWKVDLIEKTNPDWRDLYLDFTA